MEFFLHITYLRLYRLFTSLKSASDLMWNRAVKVCMFPLSRGLGAVMLRGFDPVSFGRSIEQYKITFCPIVPPVLVQIANNPLFEQFDFSSVRGFLSGT
jgi:acyl-CoA synthetase (AMP-forming)/AMP-acid ligase II